MSAQCVHLKDVAGLVNGKAFQPNDWSEDGLPIIRIQNLNGHDKPFNYWAGPLEKQVRVKPYDLLLAWSGTPGTSFGAHIWGGQDAVLNQHIFRVDLNERLITKEWARFAINSKLNTLIGLAHGGVGLKHVTRCMVEELEIPLPPLPEQRRIAAILGQADAVRAKRREALAQLNELEKAIFIEMFGDPTDNPKGWPVTYLPEVIYFQEGPGIRNWQFRTAGIKLINVGNIVDGRLELSNTSRFLDVDEVRKRYHHFLLQAGDWVVASSGVTWGKIARVEERHLPLCLNTSVIRLRPMDLRIEPLYIRAFIESASFKKQIGKLITGSAQPNFGPAHLRQVILMVPPAEVQRNYSNRIMEVENLKVMHNASIEEINTLFDSLQHRAFRGEL